MAEEKKLLLRLKQKQEKALEQAIELYTPYISTVLFNMIGTQLPVEDIEEIISDVFVTLWKNAEYIDLKKGTIRSYIAVVARNLALKRLNRLSDYTNLEDVELPDERNTIDDNIFSELIWKSVMELGEPDNEIFVRYYKFGERLKDISRVMGLNLSTIKTKLSRGKKKLKTILINLEGSL